MHLLPLLTRNHFSSLCTTGGTQPFTVLTPTFQDENLAKCATGFLDAPAFAPSGCVAKVGPFDENDHEPAVLPTIVLLDGRLS